MSTPEAEVSAAEPGITGRFKTFREQHHLAFEVAFFFAGFLFDVVLLHRIDSRPLLVHQGAYLVLSALLIFWDHRIVTSGREPQGLIGKVSGYRLWVMHFFLGTLLNAFMVFYFRASSGFLAFCFLVALAGIIIANELPRFRAQGPIVRVMLLSFAITSYGAYLMPVLWGELRTWQYFVSVLIGAIATVALWRVFLRFTRDPNWTFKRAAMPGLVIQATLLMLYVVDAIPPVPLSLKRINVAYSVSPYNDEHGRHYRLTQAKAPAWKFWQAHVDTLQLRDPKGDCKNADAPAVAVRIFAPAKFHDRITFVWEYDDPKRGWVELVGKGGRFSPPISGGSEEGWFTWATTRACHEGTYRVSVLADDREVGRKSFQVDLVDDPSTRLTVDADD